MAKCHACERLPQRRRLVLRPVQHHFPGGSLASANLHFCSRKGWGLADREGRVPDLHRMGTDRNLVDLRGASVVCDSNEWMSRHHDVRSILAYTYTVDSRLFQTGAGAATDDRHGQLGDFDRPSRAVAQKLDRGGMAHLVAIFDRESAFGPGSVGRSWLKTAPRDRERGIGVGALRAALERGQAHERAAHAEDGTSLIADKEVDRGREAIAAAVSFAADASGARGVGPGDDDFESASRKPFDHLIGLGGMRERRGSGVCLSPGRATNRLVDPVLTSRTSLGEKEGDEGAGSEIHGATIRKRIDRIGRFCVPPAKETSMTPSSRKNAKVWMILAASAATLAGALLLTPVFGGGTTPVVKVPEPMPLAAPPRIDAVFVLDTTGSMSGLIDGAKQTIWSIANQMASGTPQPIVRFGLVGYRDRTDEYVTTTHGLTADLDEVYGNLMAFTAAGGGDHPEDVNAALSAAIDQNWQQDPNVLRLIFLVGDAPPHDDYDGPKSHELAARAAEKGIIINTIRAGQNEAAKQAWLAIAHAGGGQFTSIAQSGGVVARATPYDGELARLNAELADTTIAYGDAAARESTRTKMRARKAMKPEVAAAAASYAGKTGVLGGRGDLVGALESGSLAMDDVEAEALPEDFRRLSEVQRKERIAETQKQRRELRAKITAASKKRDDYLRKSVEEAPAADSFDESVVLMLRDQAGKVGVKY